MKAATVNTRRHSSRSFARKAWRILLVIVSSLLGCVLGLVGVLLLWSPGRPIPFVDKDGSPLPASISEKIHVIINGVEQGMFIKGKDRTKPVLLFVHGGTGMPEYSLAQSYPTGLEDHFIVVWWERRGAGLSYSADIPPGSMTVEQLLSDTLEVTNYLRQRFAKEKIYLMGHSGGSFFGIQAAALAPELYHAYIGVGQMTYQIESERRAYEYMLKRFKENENERMVRKLEEGPPTMSVPLPDSYMSVRDEAMHTLGIGTTHDMKSVITGVFLPSWLNREYTLGEKVNIWRGKSFSDRILWDKMITTDLSEELPGLDLPVYFFHGTYDYTVNYTMVKDFFGKLEAPVKGFYTFEHSAHSPMFEEPERVQRILQEDVVAGANSLADVK